MNKYPNSITFEEATKSPNPVDLFLEGRAKPIAGTFTQRRVDPFTVPVGYYTYELRADEDGSWCAIEEEPIEDRFCGTLIIQEKLEFQGQPCIRLEGGNSLEFVW